jgi:hypothetical protein
MIFGYRDRFHVICLSCKADKKVQLKREMPCVPNHVCLQPMISPQLHPFIHEITIFLDSAPTYPPTYIFLPTTTKEIEQIIKSLKTKKLIQV